MQTEQNNSVDPLHQQWSSNRDPNTTYDQQDPQYAPQQNGLQIIVNLPPQQQVFGQDPNMYPNNIYTQDNAGYNAGGYQPYQTPADNHNNAYPYGKNYDDADRPPARPEDKYKVNDDQPNQTDGAPEEKKPVLQSMFMGCDLKKKISKKPLGFLIIFFVGANLAIIIALMVYHFGKKQVTLTSISGALDYISFNLGEHPVMDVRVVDGNVGCPSGYYSILLGTWPGTNAGCDCPIMGLRRGICDKTGSRNDADRYCTNIFPRSSIDMFNWGGSKWCVYRAKPGTQYTKTVECGDGFRECSTGICVLSSLSCPVTKVKIDSTGTYKLSWGPDRYVVTENVQGEPPVIDLAITPNNIPCFSEDYFASGPTSPYKLLDQNEKGCSKYGLDSDNSFQIDIQTQDRLFFQNSFPSKVLSMPDYDDIYENTNSVLSYRKRMDVAENDFCLNMDFTLMEKSSKAADDMNRFMTGTSIAAIVIHGIIFLFMSIYVGITTCKGKFRDAVKGESLKTWVFPVLFFGFMEYIDLIVMFAATKHYRGVLLETQHYFVKLSGMGCFLDGQAQAAISDYQVLADDVAGTLYKYSLTLFLLCTTCCIIPCIYLLVRLDKK